MSGAVASPCSALIQNSESGLVFIARRAPAPFVVPSRAARLRVGVPSAGLDFFGDAAAEALFNEAVARARALGAEIVDIDFAPFREAASLLYSGPWVAERLAAIKDFAAAKPAAMDATVRSIVLGAEPLRTVDAFAAFYRLADLTRLAESEWAKMDVMLLPTAGTTYKIADVLADHVGPVHLTRGYSGRIQMAFQDS